MPTPTTPAKPAPPDLSKIPTIKTIQIKFHTNNDDKDWDTTLTVSFMHGTSVFATAEPTPTWLRSGGAISTEEIDDFSDNQDTPWFNVPVESPIRKDLVPQCTTKVRIDPNGNDTWRFNYWVQLHYSDGTMDERHFDGHALSQDVRENIFSLQ